MQLRILQTTMKSVNSCNDDHSGVTVLSNAIRKSLDSTDLTLCHRPPTKRFRFQEQPHFPHSIWLGAIRSEEESGSIAYDRTAIRLRDEAFPCNFPYNRFLLNTSQSSAAATTKTAILTVADEHLADDKKKSSCNAITAAHELFQKELTPSDVGKLNRLVIPKKYAVRYFPSIRMCNDNKDLESTDAADGAEGMMLEFRDREGRRWEFRYCYWRSSQSYVFTKGWSKFVKTNVLSAKDTVVFYRYEDRGRSCNVIEVEYVSQDEDGGCRSTTRTTRREEGVGLRLEEKEDVEEGEGEGEGEKGLKLFGVHIS